jgi:hypothetical protein
VASEDNQVERFVVNLTELSAHPSLTKKPTFIRHCHDAVGATKPVANTKHEINTFRCYDHGPNGYESDAYIIASEAWKRNDQNQVIKEDVMGLASRGLSGNFLINHPGEEWLHTDRDFRIRSLLKTKQEVRQVKDWVNHFLPFMVNTSKEWEQDTNSLTPMTPLNGTYLNLLLDDPDEVGAIWKRNYTRVSSKASVIVQDYAGCRTAIIDQVEKKSTAAKVLAAITAIGNGSTALSTWVACLMTGDYVEIDLDTLDTTQSTYLRIISFVMCIFLYHPWLSPHSWSNLYITLYRLEFKSIMSTFDAAGQAAVVGIHTDFDPPRSRQEFIRDIDLLVAGIAANNVAPWNGVAARLFVESFKPGASYIYKQFRAGLDGTYGGVDAGGNPAEYYRGTYLSYSDRARQIAFPANVGGARSSERTDSETFMVAFRAKMSGLAGYPRNRTIFSEYEKLLAGTEGMASMVYAASVMMEQNLLNPDFLQGHNGVASVRRELRYQIRMNTGPNNLAPLTWHDNHAQRPAGGPQVPMGPRRGRYTIQVDVQSPIALLNSSWGKVYNSMVYIGPVIKEDYYCDMEPWERLANSVLDCAVSCECYYSAQVALNAVGCLPTKSTLAEQWITDSLGKHLIEVSNVSRAILPCALIGMSRSGDTASVLMDELREEMRVGFQRAGIRDHSVYQPFAVESFQVNNSVILTNRVARVGEAVEVTDAEYLQLKATNRLTSGAYSVRQLNDAFFIRYTAGKDCKAALTPAAVGEPSSYDPNKISVSFVDQAINFTTTPIPETIDSLRGEVVVPKWIATCPRDIPTRLFAPDQLFDHSMVLRCFPAETRFTPLSIALELLPRAEVGAVIAAGDLFPAGGDDVVEGADAVGGD